LHFYNLLENIKKQDLTPDPVTPDPGCQNTPPLRAGMNGERDSKGQCPACEEPLPEAPKVQRAGLYS